MALIPTWYSASTKQIAEKALQRGVLKYPGLCYIQDSKSIAWVTIDNTLEYVKGDKQITDVKCIGSNLMFFSGDKLLFSYDISMTDEDKDHIIEEMEGLKFKVGPKSFYQTNSEQAYNLYKITRDFAGLTGNEMVYDLYTGTGTIANFVSSRAKKVIGIEYVPEAIEDAKVNAALNNIENTLFFAGDMKDILTQEFIALHGKPDVIITDPPRAGMHDDVIDTILFAEPRRIVYVSCNPATQARDLGLLQVKYEVKKVQPVDMFPHTHHVENVVLLEKKSHS